MRATETGMQFNGLKIAVPVVSGESIYRIYRLSTLEL